jgi:hypothetical protein
MFESQDQADSLPCGHYMHKKCLVEYMHMGYKCPLCMKSIINMEAMWRKMNDDIERQPMPSQFANTKVRVHCNDCLTKSIVPYHYIGAKCAVCDSFNTNQLQHISEPDVNALIEASENASDTVSRAVEVPRPRSADSGTQILRSTGSYFQSDQDLSAQARGSRLEINEPERRPSFAAVTLENLRLTQQELLERFTPQELFDRFSRSLSPIRNYLNTSYENLRESSVARFERAASAVSDEGNDEVDFWGSDGRFLSGDEDDTEESEEEESDDSMSGSEDVDDDEDEEDNPQELDLELIGHR